MLPIAAAAAAAAVVAVTARITDIVCGPAAADFAVTVLP